MFPSRCHTSGHHSICCTGSKLLHRRPLRRWAFHTPVNSTFSWSWSLACSGCRYLSCIPRAANNHCKGYVCRLFVCLCLSSYFSGLIEPGSPPLTVDLRYRVPVYPDYCLTSYFIRTCRDTVLYSGLSHHLSYSFCSTLCPCPWTLSFTLYDPETLHDVM